MKIPILMSCMLIAGLSLGWTSSSYFQTGNALAAGQRAVDLGQQAVDSAKHWKKVADQCLESRR